LERNDSAFFSVRGGVGRLSTGYGSRMSQSLILIDILSSVFSGKEKTKKKRKGHLARRLFHPWPDMP
jgi:hypothetical protein